MRYQVLSPDGFTISHKVSSYRSIKQAKQALSEWVNNYQFQGYYSQTCYNGYIRHISLNELPDYCEIIRV